VLTHVSLSHKFALTWSFFSQHVLGLCLATCACSPNAASEARAQAENVVTKLVVWFADQVQADDYVLEPLQALALPNDEKLALIQEHEKVRLAALDKKRTISEQEAHEAGYNNNKFNQSVHLFNFDRLKKITHHQ
jgi:hypothetical protein